jgi:hypothetical protein
VGLWAHRSTSAVPVASPQMLVAAMVARERRREPAVASGQGKTAAAVVAWSMAQARDGVATHLTARRHARRIARDASAAEWSAMDGEGGHEDCPREEWTSRAARKQVAGALPCDVAAPRWRCRHRRRVCREGVEWGGSQVPAAPVPPSPAFPSCSSFFESAPLPRR